MKNILHHQRSANQTTLRFHFTPFKGSIIRKLSTNDSKGVEKRECWLVQALWKSEWKVLITLKIGLPCDSALLFVDILLTCHREMCTSMTIEALFTIAMLWNQCRCPSTESCRRKMWYVYILECFSSIKDNKVLPFLAMWNKLEITISSKFNQLQKDKYF